MAKTDRHLVVDGSNIATEGRSLPSLAQLDEAVRAIATEFPYSSLTVIVDATFAHRIDDSEREEFEAAVAAGEIVTPPAGAVGRGDAFILQVAEKAGATVLSNDSYQEFHGDHEWLFEPGRLIGGKPIDGVGWVFVERVPVRGPASRRAVRVAKKPLVKKANKRGASAEASGPPPQPTLATPPPPRKRGAGRRGGDARSEPQQTEDPSMVVSSTPATGVEGTTSGPAVKQPQPERAGKKSPEELNDPRSFMTFVSKYSIGDEVEAVVEQFSSHGCYLRAASARCYLPSRTMGDPPPNRARDVVSQGQTVIVKVESLDADRRGINVALVRAVPGDGEYMEEARDREAAPARLAKPASPPQDAPVPADGSAREGNLTRSTTNVATTKPAKKTPAKKAAATGAKKAATATSSARVKKAVTRKASATKAAAPAAEKAPAANAPAKAPAKKATAKRAPAKKTTAAKAPAKKTTATKAPAKKTTATKAPAKKTTATKAPAKKTTATKAPAKKTTATKAPAKKTTAAKAPAKKATTAKKATATKAPAKKATTRKAATRKAPARKAATKRTTAATPDTGEA